MQNCIEEIDGERVISDAERGSANLVATNIDESLDQMRGNTERAALMIGESLTQIVDTVTAANQEVKNCLSKAIGGNGDSDTIDDRSINDLVAKQIQMVDELINRSRKFFQQQLELASTANAACNIIQKSANDVSELTKTSQVLAINLRIEAARLGDTGNGFDALGSEVQSFSRDVGDAAQKIMESVGVFLDAIPEMHQSTVEIDGEMGEMSERFSQEMASITERTDELTESLAATSNLVETNNNQILDRSNETLSHLGYQDPLSQGLLRIQHDVSQMNKLIQGQETDFTPLSMLQDDVGEDGSNQTEPGLVDLF